MKILHLEDGNGHKHVIVRAILGGPEFEHLSGSLDNLCVFSTKAIADPTSCTRTGAKHSHCKWLLFPASLRKRIKADSFDFDHITCGTVEHKDCLYVVFGVPRRGTSPSKAP